ncbi:MAG TPA: hypothetical protein PLE92_04120 [Lentisphaeria bacterium]|nr:hypothetical protein [Lentisphaeria bacterium]HQL87689.1 hypothetical protein [Lentisphaeria bacterium]
MSTHKAASGSQLARPAADIVDRVDMVDKVNMVDRVDGACRIVRSAAFWLPV